MWLFLVGVILGGVGGFFTAALLAAAAQSVRVKPPPLVSRDCVRCGQRFPQRPGRFYRRVGDGTRALCLVCKDGVRVSAAQWEANAAHGYKA